MITELHILMPDDASISRQWDIGVREGKLVVSRKSFSNAAAKCTERAFDDYWLPPEMRDGGKRSFAALLSFTDDGQLIAVDYVVTLPTYSHAGANVVRIAGVDEEWWPDGKRNISVRFRSIPRPGVCILKFPVILQGDEKYFTLPDGWVTNAIPALPEFEERNFDELSGMPEKGTGLINLTVTRKNKWRKRIVIATGFVSTTGGMGEYSVIHLGAFTEGTYPIRLFADRFEVGDEVELTFNWYGKYPVVARFLDQAVGEGVVPSMEIGKSYKPDEFMQIMGTDAQESAKRVLPEMIEKKTIILKKR